MTVSISFPGALNHLNNDFPIKNSVYWHELLSDILGVYYNYLFQDGLPKNHVVLYLNGVKLDTLNNVTLSYQDSMVILSAISGG